MAMLEDRPPPLDFRLHHRTVISRSATVAHLSPGEFALFMDLAHAYPNATTFGSSHRDSRNTRLNCLRDKLAVVGLNVRFGPDGWSLEHTS